METLQGNFLIATQQMPDPRFQEQVIYLCSHSGQGAMGVVINQPSDHSLAEVLKSAELPLPAGELPLVYLGGPVEPESAFFLYSSDYEAPSCLEVSETVCLSREPQILQDIAVGNGPQRYLFVLGYAGWGPGQLEYELKDNGWLTLPADDEILFATPDGLKWRHAASRFGIDITTFGDALGNA